MILPYIVEIEEAVKKIYESGKSDPSQDQFNAAGIQPNRNVLIQTEENSFELSLLQFKKKVEKERFERELLVRNK
jgi:hypothetical protein